VKVATADQQSLRRDARLQVSVTANRPGRARVSVSALGERIAPRGTLTFRRRGTKRLTLPLNAAGRRAAAECGRLRVTAAARSYALRTAQRRRPPRRDAPAFTGGVRNRLARATRTLTADPSGCYRIGIASRSINPDPDGTFGGEPIYLGGYGFGGPPIGDRAATGILGDGVSVRAVAISDGKSHIAFADMEEQGWFAATKDGPYGIVDIRREVEQRTGGALKAERVTVQSNHTHGGPDTIGVWGGAPTAYRRFIMDRTVEAIVAAYEAEQPGSLHYGTAPGRDLLSNQFDYDASNAVVDSDVRVLQGRDPDGSAFATWLNFSAHPTVLGGSNTKASGDWPQLANPMLEQRFGGAAMTMMGTLGRTQPADRGCQDESIPKEQEDARNLCSLEEYATRVVERAADAAAAATEIEGEPVVDAHTYLIQDPATSALILGLDYVGDPLGVPIYRSLSPPWLTGNILGTITGSARVGDVLISSMPGEAYPQIPLKVQELAPGLRGYMTAGLANDQLGYLIAPYEAYPEPIRRSAFNERGDEVSPIDNDNYFFNVSHTMGERITCSLLRGTGELLGKGLEYRSAHDRCVAFPNDLQNASGADTR
jgi:hypothetical protein